MLDYAEYNLSGKLQFDKGLEYNNWLEYLWDTALEIGFMVLEKERYTGADISEYIPLIESSLRFFDEHYQYLAKQRGTQALDGKGKLVLYPGSACETYKMAYNSSSTIAALQTDGDQLLTLPAWPSNWDVHFKLHAPYNKVVECKYVNGKMQELKVNGQKQ
ncbi:hypothetical protein FACS1894160_0290 [Bacteroidia bacterium]|nr:hypothetical protein FACS1894160_0290 [Bacteroidia bacterium]